MGKLKPLTDQSEDLASTVSKSTGHGGRSAKAPLGLRRYASVFSFETSDTASITGTSILPLCTLLGPLSSPHPF